MNSPFPPEIFFASVEAAQYPQAVAELLPEERNALSPQANERRILQFALGRKAAHLALSAAGIAPAALLRVDKTAVQSAPKWPVGVVGSIAHSNQSAVAAVAPNSALRAIGIDIETITSSTVEILPRIASPEEQAWVKGHGQRATLLFSAKEAIFKALNPLHGMGMGFRDVVLKEASGGQISLQLLRNFGEFRANSSFPVLFSEQTGMLVTGIVILNS
jgi:4'-phosphopantetheinyl transferase EntD